jgi:hypothetical protein
MQATIPDLQIALNKVRDFESYYAMSQWPGGWTADMVGIDPAYLPALEEAGFGAGPAADRARLRSLLRKTSKTPSASAPIEAKALVKRRMSGRPKKLGDYLEYLKGIP